MAEWFSIKDRLPEKSGEYITFGSSIGVTSMLYSAKNKHFNSTDNDDEERVAKYAIDSVTHWCYLPEPPALNDNKEE